jgi:hypothetical protein
MKVLKQTSRVDTRSAVRSVSLQIRDYQVTVKVRSAVPQPRPAAFLRTTAR